MLLRVIQPVFERPQSSFPKCAQDVQLRMNVEPTGKYPPGTEHA
jgi:hypothetical protein